jgi:Fe-S cluster assembly scaffold protein SufB
VNKEEIHNEDESFSISVENECNKACQTQSKRFRSVETQTYSKPSNTIDQFDFDNVSYLIEILIDSRQNWTSINNRILSVTIYLTLYYTF